MMKDVVGGRLVTLKPDEPIGIEARLARLEDERSICEVIYHYARCVDARDSAGVAAAFVEEGCMRVPGGEPVFGRRDIERLYAKLLPKMTSSTHLVANPQVLFITETTASLHSVFFSWEGFHEGISMDDRYTFGRYEASLVKELDGEWRFLSLLVSFAGQTGSERFAEHLGRPFPPQPMVD